MMKRTLNLIALISFMSLSAFAQNDRSRGVTDRVDISIGRNRPIMEGTFGAMPHPYHVEARHWPKGCEAAKAAFDSFGTIPAAALEVEREYKALSDAPAPTTFTAATPAELGKALNICGAKFYEYDGENLVTSAGETAISKAISDTAAQPASANYIALTNTGITPAVGDTTLSGEIVSNGLQRVIGVFTDTSAAIGTPPTPGAISQVGAAGSTTVDYWVFACTFQGCTAVGTAAQTTVSNATLSTTVYNTFTFTGKLGAAFYRVVRSHNNTTITGALAGGSTITTADGEISVGYISCATDGGLIAGTAPTCTVADQSNTLTAFTVPASDQTFVGKYTLTKTFTATGAQSAQAFGIFNAASVGTLYYEGTFSSAALITNDTLAFTETVYH